MASLYGEDGIDGPFERGMSNPYEDRARLEKVLKLSAAIDRIARESFKDPNPSVIASALRKQAPGWWRHLATLADVRPPSEKTIEAVIRHYEGQAKAEFEDPFAGLDDEVWR